MRILIDGQTLATPEMTRGIGRVLKILVERLVQSDLSKRWYVSVNRVADLDALCPTARLAVTPLLVPAAPAGLPLTEANARYGDQLARLVREHRINGYWNANPMMINVRFPLGAAFGAAVSKGLVPVFTVHDLIPFILPERYLKQWPAEVAADYVARLDALATLPGAIIATVSAASANEFKAARPESQSRTVPILHGYDRTLLAPYAQGARLSDPPYILFVGGFDPRKNMEGAVRAFAQFVATRPPASWPILKVVCAYDPSEKTQLMAKAAELGVGNHVELPGFVSDATLAQLFRGAHLFFFPSIAEGFGLPLLDAMAAGVPIVASDIAASREVCGELARYAPADDYAGLARALTAAWDERLAQPGTSTASAALSEHALTFSWSKAARAYADIFSGLAQRPTGAHKPRVAMLTPWPPAKNGIADFCYALAPPLAQHFNLTIFAPSMGDSVGQAWPDLPGVTVLPISSYAAQAGEFAAAIYHIGNGLAHREIYPLARLYPSIVVLHDFVISPFIHHAYRVSSDPTEQFWAEEALLGHGERGRQALTAWQARGESPDTFALPMSQTVATHSKAVIVHSRAVAERLALPDKTWTIHHGATAQATRAPQQLIEARDRLALPQTQFYVGVFGFINLHKRVASAIAAVGELRRRGYPVTLLLVGEVNDQRVDVAALAAQHGLTRESLQTIGYVDNDLFDDFMLAVDVVLNLRYPSMGESSGSLFRALAAGVPCIVSDLDQFAELPSDVVWKADLGDSEVATLVAYLEHLLRHPETRATLGANAQQFIRDYATFDQVAACYAEVVASVADQHS